jgi:5S rRNA maturation endonuclease (ribonuclease M5)
VPGTATAQNSAPKSQHKLALGQDDVKQLLLLMDTDRNGKISKQEHMKFMEAEFERLDKDKKRGARRQGINAIEFTCNPQWPKAVSLNEERPMRPGCILNR